jgi:hypothetical protein
MNKLPIDAVPPNVLYLQGTQDGASIPAGTYNLTYPLLNFSSDHFHDIAVDEMDCIFCLDPIFGFDLGTNTTSSQSCL